MEKIQQYFDLMKDIEENLLSYIEESNEYNEYFMNYLEKQKIIESKYMFKSFLHLLAQISNNYHRTRKAYDKIDCIISHFKNSIQNYFQNSEIFHIFQDNKRILLFLIQQKILTINQSIFNIFNQTKFRARYYLEYFFPEIESFLQEPLKTEIKKEVKELNENDLELFNEKRKQGENDHILCSYIRNDQVIDFITYLEKTNLSPSSEIKESIYETNPLLMQSKITNIKGYFMIKKNSQTLIEYSAFFGSQQILVYLFKKDVKITNSIWPYIIHGKNPELFHFLEENKIDTLNKSYQYLIVESIKCHHNEITDYLLNNVSHEEHIYKKYLLKKHLKYYNYNLKDYKVEKMIQLSIKSDLFYFFSKYDYFLVVQFLLTIPELNINQQYKIFKPRIDQNEIVLSIDIKNGNLEKYLKEKDIILEDIEIPWQTKPNEYENDYYIYFYDLNVTSALLISAQKGNIDIIQLLLNSKVIDTNIKSKKYYKKYTAYGGFLIISEERTLLHEAIENCHVDVVLILLQLGIFNMNDYLIKSELFIDSHSTAHTEILNEYHKTPLIIASELGYSEIMHILLSQGKADINQIFYTIECESGGCEYYSRTANRIEKTVLYLAIEKNNLNIVKICLEQPNIDVNIPFLVKDLTELKIHKLSDYFDEPCPIKVKFPPLNLAVSMSNIDIICLLLKHPNIDINKKSSSLRTPLHIAVIKQKTEIIQLLLQQKAIDVNALDENNKKPIDYTDDQKIKKLFMNLQK